MPQPAETLPPCIVLGLETQIGLSVVRELGRAGIRVIGIAHEAHAIGLSSRYLWRRLVVPAARSEELLTVLRTLGEEHGPCSLITVSEANLAWLVQQRDALGQVTPIVPDADKLAVVLDKQRTLDAADAVGITTPVTVQLRSLEEARALAPGLDYPLVLKWKDPNAVSKKLGAAGLSLIKAEYVYNAEQLMAAAQRYAPLNEWPIVQGYCPGVGLGQFFYMHKGQAVRRFQHVRVAEWPPEGGFSSVCDAVPTHRFAKLQEQSIALLRHIGWEGVAMVEYRWDPATDRAVLMEINGRYWGSYPLAMHSLANFALISYHVANGLPLPALPEPRSDLRCRMMSTEIKRLVRILLQPGLIIDRSFKIQRTAELVRFLLDFVRPNVRYYVWDVRDPKPFLADLANVLRR